MKRIHTITLKNFKAFQDADPIVLDGRNLLLYGANGSGKSSLYWALHTFLQSSRKTASEVAKYFDRRNNENLANVHVPTAPASISVTLRDPVSKPPDEVLQIAADKHETPRADIEKACKASDFVTYRVMFRFYHFTNSEQIDLWPVFEREILPFCRTTLISEMEDAWRALREKNPLADAQSRKARGRGATAIYDAYDVKVAAFAVALGDVLNTISKTAQQFYDDHFRHTGDPELAFEIGMRQKPSYDRGQHVLVFPQIGLKVTYGGISVPRPQSFLNEALLTQIALSIRFGATKANLQDSPIKLMVLDDLLISLDMSNRMQVIDIILSDKDFQDYQKIIMTHDRGFYREIRRKIGNQHTEWVFLEMNRRGNESPDLRSVKDDLQQAEDYLAHHKLDECAAALRKAAESNIRRFSEEKLKIVFDSGKFHSLAEDLRAAKHKIEEVALHKVRRFLRLAGYDDSAVDQVIPLDDADWQTRDVLDEPSKGKLKTRGKTLRNFLKEHRKSETEALEVIEKIDEVRGRILNPGAHAGAEPLYEREVKEAIELLRRLQSVVDGASAPAPAMPPATPTPMPNPAPPAKS